MQPEDLIGTPTGVLDGELLSAQLRGWELAAEGQRIYLEQLRKWGDWPSEDLAREEERLEELMARLNALREQVEGHV